MKNLNFKLKVYKTKLMTWWVWFLMIIVFIDVVKNLYECYSGWECLWLAGVEKIEN